MKHRRGSSLIQDLAVVAIIGMIAYMLFPQWFTGFIPGSSSTFSAQIAVTDINGETTYYNSNGNKLTVVVSGGSTPINQIGFTVKAKPTWTDPAPSISGVSWDVSGAVKLDGVTKQTIGTPPTLPTTIYKGVDHTISTTSISGSTLDQWVPNDGADHTLSFQVTVKATFTPPGYTEQQTIQGSPVASLKVRDAGFPAVLSVSISYTYS